MYYFIQEICSLKVRESLSSDSLMAIQSAYLHTVLIFMKHKEIVEIFKEGVNWVTALLLRYKLCTA